jgi:hypothetical protein
MVSGPAIATTSLPNRWMVFPHCDRSNRGTNAAIRPHGPIRILVSATRHTDTKRHAANGVPGHDKHGQARPRSSCPGLIRCPAQWAMAKPYPPRHSPRRQALGGWHGRHRSTLSGEAPPCPGPWTDRLSQVALRPRSSFASAIVWCHSSHGIILDQSLSAHIKDPTPVEPSDYRRAGERGSGCDESYLPHLGTQQLASFAFHCRSTRDHNLCN